jgi:glycosyltransferase involved in cell wall biosynthesis
MADEMMLVNIEGTRNIVNASLLNNVKKLVHISSIAAIGRDEKSDIITENTAWTDSEMNTNYAKSKYLSELEVWRGVEEGLNSIILNTKTLKSYLREETFDYYYLAHPLNVLEFHLARGIRKKDTIITEHGAPNAYNIIYKKVKSWLYPKAKIYIVPTTSDTIHYKGINLPAVYLPHFRSDLKYEKAKLKNNIALSIGRFTDVKQQISLLRVWNTLINSKNIKNWKLYIVGEGELHEEYLDYILTNNLKDYVFLLPPRKDVEFYYRQATLFLLTSKSEGFGMVLLEAISFGLPCISYDCPSGPRDIIVNNKNGYLIKNADEIAFEIAILKLFNDTNLIQEMSNASFSISENWKDKQLLEQWYSILN